MEVCVRKERERELLFSKKPIKMTLHRGRAFRHNLIAVALTFKVDMKTN